MIALFTDFGLSGPYVGQMHAVLVREAPGVPVIDLFHDLPPYRVSAAAYLLPAYTQGFPVDSIFVCVVDPGVGSPRKPLLLRADHRWYLGPDNGLFGPLAARARDCQVQEIVWTPPRLSASFHGRDLFAPVAARIARGGRPETRPAVLTAPQPAWPADLAEVVYIDRFGNAVTGLRAETVPVAARLRCGEHLLERAQTFSDVAPGSGFWYENANGLVEIAVNQGSAAGQLGIGIGRPIDVSLP